MPGQNGAFDTRWKLMHASENGELAEILPIHPAGRHHLVDLVEEGFDLRFGFPLHRGGQNGSCSLGNRATGTLKADIFDDLAVHEEVKSDVVAADRIMALCGPVGPFQLAE